MIQLKRDRDAVPGGLKGHHLRNKSLALLKLKRDKTTIPSGDFKSSYWKASKDQLKIESFGKCAYCEADTSVVAHGDVEHYRPKSVYWWLAYCHDNYLYSCQICNQVFKGNNFPRAGTKLRAPVTVHSTDTDAHLETLKAKLVHDPHKINDAPTWASFEAKWSAERALLPNPYLVDPEPMLQWAVDNTLETVRVEGRVGVPDRDDITTALTDYYGLNREVITKPRWKTYRIAEKAAAIVARNISPADVADAKDILRLMIANDFRFAGMTRYFVREIWQVEL